VFCTGEEYEVCWGGDLIVWSEEFRDN